MYRDERLQLLSEYEVESIYDLPSFNDEERVLYFNLTPEENNLSKKYRTVKARVYFICLLAYFKAKQQFFKFKLDTNNTDDVKYIFKNYLKKKVMALSGIINERTYKKQKENILRLYNYNDWTSNQTEKIKTLIESLIRSYPKSRDAIRQLLVYFDAHNIVIPSYRTIQDMFTRAFSNEEKRLDKVLSSMEISKRNKLLNLLNKENGLTLLSIIKADQKDFRYTAVKLELKKANELRELYQFSKNFIPILQLSKNAIRYYADLVEIYPASNLRKLNLVRKLLYILCYVYHRYQQIMDNLIKSFIYHMNEIVEDVKKRTALARAEYNESVVVDIPKLAQFLEWFPGRDHALSNEELDIVAYGILPKSQFTKLSQFLAGVKFDKQKTEWRFVLKAVRKLSLYLRPIILEVPLIYYKENNKIIDYINLIKSHYESGKMLSVLKTSKSIEESVPTKAIPYLKENIDDSEINIYLFEFYVYKKILHHLEKGRLCCNDSVSYADLEIDLGISQVDNVESIAVQYGFGKIPIYCDERLDAAIFTLNEAWERVTDNIKNGKNKGLHIYEGKEIKDSHEWSLLYDSSEKLDDEFFKNIQKNELVDVLDFVGNKINVWDNFSHMKDRYLKKKKPIIVAIEACILSEAFGFSMMKMSDISDLPYTLLRSTRENFIRIDSLCDASDGLCNYAVTLPIFKRWSLMLDRLLADADGQKFATSNDTLQSRYSKKYIGKGKGISLYTLIANFIAVNAKNIGLNEYEGHALYDIIYNNKTDIEIDMVTGDNHSLNQLNFVVLDSIDVDYVLSIKNVREAANDLYSAKSVSDYQGLIKPKRQINIALIRSQRKNIIRVLLSLLTQENTQTNIIRKLNSHARYARLRAALVEYNHIFRTIHILNLIDDIRFRKAIRTARNRTESYHQLQKTIRKTYGEIFKGKTINNNRVSAHATRLVANCIIVYNAIILNTVYKKMCGENVSREIIDEFLRISPIAWAHLIFTGMYSFKKVNNKIDVAAITQDLERQLRDNFWTNRRAA